MDKRMTVYRACEIVEGFDGQPHTLEEVVAAVQFLIDKGWYGRTAARMLIGQVMPRRRRCSKTLSTGCRLTCRRFS